MTENNQREEQQRVNLVVTKIDQQIADLQEQVHDKKADIVDLRKNFWNDVRVNFDDAGEAAETYRSIKQQAETLSERERMHKHAEKQLHVLLRLKQSPYFGRIDFREDGETTTEQIYLGIASFLDEDSEQFLVYDWRAPVSSLYYDYQPGPAEYETPSGKISGEIVLKRQFVIRNGSIISQFDTGVTIGDEVLQEVLGKQADSQMKSIVATIQKEQNRIIRNEHSRLLIVQGAAGSGKTSAALQRAAYLLYRFRKTLRSDNIVLFSPNPLFNSYISTVLPELGEENMHQTTFQEYLERRLGDMYQVEDPFMQMEYVYTAMEEPGYSERMAGIRFKASAGFLEMIHRYIELLGRQDMRFKDIRFKGDTVIAAESIKEQFYGFDASIAIPNRIRMLVDRLLLELERIEQEERSKPWVEDEIELLEKEDYARAYQQLRKQKKYTENSFGDIDSEREMLASMVVRRHLKPLRKFIKNLRFINISGVYRQLFEPEYAKGFPDADLSDRWDEICSQTVSKLDTGELAYEDASPFLYLKKLIEGFETNSTIRHVFIDEAQDYSPFQFAFLKRLFPFSKMTVLGDWNQAIYGHSDECTGFDPFLSLFEPAQTETIVLTQSYRSTRQIVEFTKELLAAGEDIVPFNRSGNKPTVTHADNQVDLAGNIIDRIHQLQSENRRTIAIICKSFAESKKAFELMKERIPVQLIGKEAASFEAGVLVIPAYLAKGVEFDAVIIYNASATVYGRENERKLFYTACTRAMHELHICYIGSISPFLAAVSSEKYQAM